MGVDGLLKALSPISQQNVHIKRYAGKTVVIDGYTWLHKASYACSQQIVMSTFNRQQKNGRYPSFVEYCLYRLKLMRHYNVNPIVIFDGGKLVAKESTEGKRDERRKKASKAGIALLEKAQLYPKGSREAARLLNEAKSQFQQAISISPAVMAVTIEALRKNNFKFIIAPYEADAQLAYEVKVRSGCDVIVTEDSDVIVYCLAAGATNAKVLCKMDRNGVGTEVDIKKFREKQVVNKLNLNKVNKEGGSGWEKSKRRNLFIENLHKMSPTMFVQMAVLAGCDYCHSIKGIGIKKAQLLVVKFAKSPDEQRLLHIINHVGKADKKKFIPLNYEQNVKNAMFTFMHHWVVETRLGAIRMVNLNPIAKDVEKCTLAPIIGEKYCNDILRLIVTGIIHPRTRRRYKEVASSTSRKNNVKKLHAYGVYKYSKKNDIKSCDNNMRNSNCMYNTSPTKMSRVHSSSASSFNMPLGKEPIVKLPLRKTTQFDSSSKSIPNAIKNDEMSVILGNLSNLTERSIAKHNGNNEGRVNISDLATPGKQSVLSKTPNTRSAFKGDKSSNLSASKSQKETIKKYHSHYCKNNSDQKTMNNFFSIVSGNPLLAKEAKKKKAHNKSIGIGISSNTKERKNTTYKRKKKNIFDKGKDNKIRKLTAFFARKEIP
jgi:5'-3' exonuclease